MTWWCLSNESQCYRFCRVPGVLNPAPLSLNPQDSQNAVMSWECAQESCTMCPVGQHTLMTCIWSPKPRTLPPLEPGFVHRLGRGGAGALHAPHYRRRRRSPLTTFTPIPHVSLPLSVSLSLSLSLSLGFLSLSLYLFLSLVLSLFLSLALSPYLFLFLSLSLWIALSIFLSFSLSFSLLLSLYRPLSFSLPLYVEAPPPPTRRACRWLLRSLSLSRPPSLPIPLSRPPSLPIPLSRTPSLRIPLSRPPSLHCSPLDSHERGCPSSPIQYGHGLIQSSCARGIDYDRL